MKVNIKIKIKILILMMALAIVPASSGQASLMSLIMRKKSQALVQSMGKQITALDEGLNGEEGPMEDTRQFLSQMRFRFRPYASFGIPDLVQIRVVPWMELEFRRKPPQGWENWRPKNPEN